MDSSSASSWEIVPLACPGPVYVVAYRYENAEMPNYDNILWTSLAKIKFQGKPWDQANKEHLQKELGDIMWYVAQAALALDMRLDEVIYINTLKLAARYPEGMFDVNYSENRAPGDI